MDRRYRFSRHLYDVTRRYSLLGRDKLLDQVVTDRSSATLEVGCGTARNLLQLASRPEPGRLYGLDAMSARALQRSSAPASVLCANPPQQDGADCRLAARAV